MSHAILDLFQYTPRKDYRDECYAKLKADFPLLGSALVGNYDAEKKTGHTGGTLMLFIEDDRIKWTFHHKATRITLFGTMPDLVLALEDVEKSMAAGHYDTKKKRS